VKVGRGSLGPPILSSFVTSRSQILSMMMYLSNGALTDRRFGHRSDRWIEQTIDVNLAINCDKMPGRSIQDAGSYKRDPNAQARIFNLHLEVGAATSHA